MQCSSCRFENMPGVDICGRCGSTLRVATAVLDVRPPRAGPWVKRFRRVFPIRRASYLVRDTASREITRFATDWRVPLLDRQIVARMLVPGWAHNFTGQKVRGLIFLGVYLAFLLPGILLFGTPGGSVLLGLAFSAHASSAMDLIFQRHGPMPSRMATTFVTTALLGVLLYLPAGWLLTRVAEPITINFDDFPFQDGDVVLVNQWAYLRTEPVPGDVVLYNTQGHFGWSEPLRGEVHGYMRIHAGQGIDRIVAGPGSLVLWERGKLLVDGKPSSLQPLAPQNLPPRLKSRVPDEAYLILPSTVNVRANPNVQVPDTVWQNLAAVPRSQIVGRAYLRKLPWNRFWFIR
jgi:hypothetical protein